MLLAKHHGWLPRKSFAVRPCCAAVEPHSTSCEPDTNTSPSSLRHYRRAAPAPSPLHNTTAISPPSSASPTKLNFAFEVHEPTYGSVPQIVTTGPEEPRSPSDNLNAYLAAEKSYYDSDSSGAATPEEKIPGFVTSLPMPYFVLAIQSDNKYGEML